MGYSIGIDEAGAWVKGLKGKLRKAAMKGLLSAGNRMVQHIQVTLIPKAQPHMPVDRGLYRGGWHVRETATGALVYNNAPHAAFIEYGVRRARIGQAMIDALTDWVLRKGLVARASDRAGRASTRQQAQNIAWAIAKDMQRRGIFAKGKGLGILAAAVEKAPTFIRQEIKREVDTAKGRR